VIELVDERAIGLAAAFAQAPTYDDEEVPTTAMLRRLRSKA